MLERFSLSSFLLFLALLLAGVMPHQAIAGPATHFHVTAAATASAGTPFSVTVTALDATNATDATYTGPLNLTSTDPAASTLLTNQALTNGVGTFAVTLKTAGSQTVTATDTGTASITGTSGAISVAAGPATHFAVTAPVTSSAGTPLSVSVTALDQFSNIASGYGGTVHFLSSDAGAVLPANATLTGGVGTFTNAVTLKTAGNQTIVAQDTVTTSIAGTSGPVLVTVGPVNHFTVSAPTNTSAGTPFSVTVTAQDQAGNTVTGYAGIVNLTSSDPAVPTLLTNQTLTNGVGSFSVSLLTPGNQTVTATDTASVTGTSGTIVVRAGAATHFVLTTPATASAGTPFSVTVTALDQFSNIASGYSGVVTLTSTDPAALTLLTNQTLTNGVGTFAVTLKTAGSQTVTATDTGTASITGTSGAISVAAGPATHFAVTAPVTSSAGTPLSVSVTALDQFSNIASGYGGTVHFLSSDAGAVLPANATLTGGVGTFTNAVTLKTSGQQTITVTDTVTAGITGTSGTIAVSAGGATHITLTAPAGTSAGVPFSVTVTALDQFSNVATGYSGVVTLTSTDPAVPTLLTNQTLTNGVGSFSVSLYTSGSRVITATDTANALTAASTILVSADATIHFQVSTPASTVAGTPFTVAVTALDQFNNTVTTYGGTIHFTSSDPAATLPPDALLVNGIGIFSNGAALKTAGTQTITVADTATPSLAGTSGTILVNNVVPTISAAVPSPVTAGGPGFTLTVTNTDSSYVAGSVVQWNGATLATTFTNARTLTAAVPAGLIATAGSANVTVFSPTPGGGVSAAAIVLIDNPVPVLSSLSPGSAVVGSPAFTLTVTGTSFISTSVVQWNGAARPTTYLSATQLAAAIPTSDTASLPASPVQITVFTADPNVLAGHSSAALPFAITAFPTPTITSLSQSVATRGDTVTLTINGTNFLSSPSSPIVTIGPITPIAVAYGSASQITATFTIDPKTPPSTYPVQVTNPDGGQSGTLPFAVNAQTVTISALTPSSATVGDAPLTVSITGTGFRQSTTVTIGGTPAASAFVSATQITANVTATLLAAASAGPGYPVQATNPDGSLSPVATDAGGITIPTDAPGSKPLSGTHFTVVGQALSLNSTSPSSGTAGDTDTIILNGSGFKNGATVAVTYNGVPIPITQTTFVSPTELTISLTLPLSTTLPLITTTQSYQISILATNPDKTPAPQPVTFLVTPQKASLGGLVPSTVNVGDPTFPLTINGTGFRTDSTVTVNGTPVPVVFISSSQLTATVGGSDFTASADPNPQVPLTDLTNLAGASPVVVTNPDQSFTSLLLKVAPLQPDAGTTTFQSGIQLFSVPYDYNNDLLGPDPTEGVFHYLGAVNVSGALLSLPIVQPGISLATWDPSTGAYALSTPATPLTLGRGYWVNFPAVTNGLIRKGIPAQSITAESIPAHSVPPARVNIFSAGNYSIALAQGWNMIGDPYTNPVQIGTLKVQYGAQPAFSFTTAVGLGLISGTLYSYDNPSSSAAGAYVPQDGTKALNPFVGYWVLALQPCTLLVPQP